ncbi:MAG: molybdopterin-dependent oxidoreductase [Candidatus Hodarchaeota archaeon]
MPLETKNKVVCPGCSLLCDDIAVDVQFNKVVKVHNACLRGSRKINFSTNKSRLKKALVKPEGTSNFTEMIYDDALKTSVDLIKKSKHVVISGINHLCNDAQALAFQLASKINARISITDNQLYDDLNGAISRNGLEFFTLGEVINNSDLILFWGANPIDRMPKLVVKTIFSRGRYRQTGKEVKKFAVIDGYPSPTMERADIKIVSPCLDQVLVLKVLVRGLIENNTLEKTAIDEFGYKKEELEVLEIPDTMQETIKDLLNALKYVEYTTIFIGEGMLNTQFLRENKVFLDKLLIFVKELNKHSRVAMTPLFYPYNYKGAAEELKTIDPFLEMVNLNQAIEAGEEVDLIVSIGSDFVSRLGSTTFEKIKDLPIISLDFKESPTTRQSRIVLPVKLTGIESSGIVTRFDGSLLKFNPVVRIDDGLRSDREILEYFLEHLE